MTELLPGVYKYQDRESYTNSGEILLSVQDKGESLRLQLISNTMRYSTGHMEMIFGSKRSVNVKKKRSRHAINIVGDSWFCIYPYRAGIPFVFEKIEKPNGGDAP